jgi:hypothetical protein
MSLKEKWEALSRRWKELQERSRYNIAHDPGPLRFSLGLAIVLIAIHMLAAWYDVPFHVNMIRKGRDNNKQATQYSVKFHSFDPEMGEALATVRASPDIAGPKAFEDVENKLCFVSPMKITDLSLHVFFYGAQPDSFSQANELSVMSYGNSSRYSWEKEEKQEVKFEMVGNLVRYPFDRYLIVGNIDQMIGCEPAGREPLRKHLVADSIDIDFNIPGYDAKRMSKEDLTDWVGAGRGTLIGIEKRLNQETFGDPAAYWEHHVFYFEVERPSLFRNLAALMGVVALISIVTVSVKTEPSEMVKTLAASLVALWGLRNILGTSGPKIPTILDYGVLLLFVLQLSIVAYRLLVLPANTEAEDPVPDA